MKMVLELLKMEVREDMRAAIITDIIRPLSPGNKDRQSHPEHPSVAGWPRALLWAGTDLKLVLAPGMGFVPHKPH